MNKTVVAVVGIIAVVLLIGFYVWSSHNRYYIMMSSRGVAYEVDRKTGKSWMLLDKKKIPHEDITRREEELPPVEAAKVEGNAHLSYGFVAGSIYNGSTWTLTRIIVNITAMEQDGSVRWSRDFSENIKVESLQSEFFSVHVNGIQGIEKVT